jgi:hypothetical protein
MAYLLNLLTGQPIPLMEHHTLGSLELKADTYISQPFVSRLHAAIEWTGNAWRIKDLSRNGTWLNEKRLPLGEHKTLHIKDVIQFASLDNHGFEVCDLSPPSDILLPMDYVAQSTFAPVVLSQYNLLPNEEVPEISIYLDGASQQWQMDSFSESASQCQLLEHGSQVRFAGKVWFLFCAQRNQLTDILQGGQNLNQFALFFDVSLDEETTDLRLVSPYRSIDCGVRSHHNLLLQLARHRAQDINRGLSANAQGWIYMEQLTGELGLYISHINIQIFRARKQLTELVPNTANSSAIIERRGGRLRLGTQCFNICKGGKVEFSNVIKLHEHSNPENV